MYIVRTPNPFFTGERLGIKFKGGIAKVEDNNKIIIFKIMGYKVEEIKQTKKRATTKGGDK